MAVAAGIEPTTCSLGESRSIQLSYATAFYLCRKNRTNHPQRAVPDVALGLDLFNDRFTGPFYVCFRASIYYSPVSAKIKRQSEKRGISLTYH